MGHQQAYLAAADGKHRANNSNSIANAFVVTRRLLMAAAVLFAASAAPSPSQAQSGPFAGLAGSWNGGGTVTLDDGSKERIRCRATYQVAGANMTMTLTCASDAYKFQLSANVVDQGGAVSGNWTETSRNISGTLQGRGAGGSFDVLASTGGFNANISLRTSGNKQSISMRADSQFRAAAIPAAVRRWYDVPLRAAMAATLVAAVVAASAELGPTLTGILAVFPIVMGSFVVILHPRVGGPAAGAVLAHAEPALVGLGLGFLGLHYLVEPLGVWWGFAGGLAIAMAWSVTEPE